MVRNGKNSSLSAGVAVLCIVLVSFTGLVQAVHVHRANAGSPSRDCSICSVAHCAVAPLATFVPDPIFVRAQLVVVQKTLARSSGFAASLHIRPPPVLL